MIQCRCAAATSSDSLPLIIFGGDPRETFFFFFPAIRRRQPVEIIGLYRSTELCGGSEETGLEVGPTLDTRKLRPSDNLHPGKVAFAHGLESRRLRLSTKLKSLICELVQSELRCAVG